MKKKIIGILSISLAVLLLLSSCAGKSNSSDGSSKDKTSVENTQTQQNIDPLGKYNPPITLSIAGTQMEVGVEREDGMTYDKNVWSEEYEKSLGITFTNKWLSPPDKAEEKTNLQIASGDIPDIISVNARQFHMLLENDMVADLTDIYDKYATDLTKSKLSSDGGKSLLLCQDNGKLCAIPSVDGFIPTAQLVWIRLDWMKNVNMELPKTMDELYALAKAFVEKDPDQNGKKDTVAFAVSGAAGLDSIESIFNGFHANTKKWVKDKDGNIVYGGAATQAKDALKFIQKCYSEGLINKEFATYTDAKMEEQVSSGKAGIYSGVWWSPSWPLVSAVANNPKADWIPIEVPSVDGELVKNSVRLDPPYYVVNKECEHPEAVVKMMNLWTEKVYGTNADPLKYNESGSVTYSQFAKVMTWDAMEMIDQSQMVRDALKTGDTSKMPPTVVNYYNCAKEYKLGNAEEENIAKFPYRTMYGENSPCIILKKLLDNNQYVIGEYYGTGTPTMKEKMADLENLQLQTYIKIITGGSIEEFDHFVKQFYNAGGNKIIKEIEEWSKTKPF